MADFLQSFFPNVTATFFGVVLGIVGGLWADRRLAEKRKRASHQTVLEAYRQALSASLRILTAIQKTLIPKHAVLCPTLNLGQFQALAGRAVETLSDDDLPLVQCLNNFQYQLEQLGRKIDIQLAMAFGPHRADQLMGYVELVDAIGKDAANLQIEAKEILEGLDSRLQ